MKELHRFEDLELDNVIHEGKVEQIEEVKEIPRFEISDYENKEESEFADPQSELEFEKEFTKKAKRKRHHYRINFPNPELLDWD